MYNATSDDAGLRFDDVVVDLTEVEARTCQRLRECRAARSGEYDYVWTELVPEHREIIVNFIFKDVTAEWPRVLSPTEFCNRHGLSSDEKMVRGIVKGAIRATCRVLAILFSDYDRMTKLRLNRIKNAAKSHAIRINEAHGDTILTPQQVAEKYWLSTATLQRWRTDGTGPQFVKLGKRRIGYRAVDLMAWEESRLATSTAQTA